MWQDKKFIVIVGLLVAIIVLGGTLGGIALARQNDGSRPQMNIVKPNLPDQTFNQDGTGALARILDNFLQKLVDEEKITQEEADQFKTWLEAQPNLPTDELKQWFESRPNMPDLFTQADESGKKFFGLVNRGENKLGFGFGCWSY